MRTSVRRTLCATAIAGGFTVLGIAFATSSATAADEPGSTSGANGLVSGNQTGPSAETSGGTSGNQVTVIGDGNNNAGSSQNGGGSTADSGGDTTDGQDGTGAGNQTDADATAPLQASGNQVTVIGDGNNNTADSDQNGTGSSTADSSGDTTDGQDATGAGNQTDADATAPLQASGNQVTVIGDGNNNTSDSDQ